MQVMQTVPLWLTAVGAGFLVLGALIFAVSGVGVLRLKDVYERASAVCAASGFGTSLMFIGVWCWQPSWGNLLKLFAALILQMVTSAVGSASVARAAYLTGSPMYSGGRLRRIIIRPDGGRKRRRNTSSKLAGSTAVKKVRQVRENRKDV